MTVHRTDAGRDGVDVHNRLDKVVLAVIEGDGARAQTELTPDDAREVARLLMQAADSGERTPRGS